MSASQKSLVTLARTHIRRVDGIGGVADDSTCVNATVPLVSRLARNAIFLKDGRCPHAFTHIHKFRVQWTGSVHSRLSAYSAQILTKGRNGQEVTGPSTIFT